MTAAVGNTTQANKIVKMNRVSTAKVSMITHALMLIKIRFNDYCYGLTTHTLRLLKCQCNYCCCGYDDTRNKIVKVTV